MASGGVLGSVFHLFVAVYFSVVMYYDLKLVLPHVETFGGRWKFLTFLNLVIQVAFFLLAVLGDVLTFIVGREISSVVAVRDRVFASITFPYGLFVCATFWGIYFVDRELIFPVILDSIIPVWINHGLHTWSCVFMILEGAIVHHHYPSNRAGIFCMLLLAATYLGWISYIAKVKEFWVYPFLRLMEAPARVLFFGLCAVILLIFYFMGKWMTSSIWEAGDETTKKVQDKKPAGKKKTKKVE